MSHLEDQVSNQCQHYQWYYILATLIYCNFMTFYAVILFKCFDMHFTMMLYEIPIFIRGSLVIFVGSSRAKTTKADTRSCEWTDSPSAWTDAHGHTFAATAAVIL